jgi:hypothetical protein
MCPEGNTWNNVFALNEMERIRLYRSFPPVGPHSGILQGIDACPSCEKGRGGLDLRLPKGNKDDRRIQSLDNLATRVTLPEGTSPTTMKNRLLRVGAELGIPVTIRKVPGGLLFWRSTDEDIQQAKEVGARLRTARRRPQSRPRGRRPRRTS